MKDLICTHCSDDQGKSKPIMVIVSDGGPHHRVTFGSVKVASLALFRSLDLDMLICVRTCPYQSWQNVAERVMSTLNLVLQNVSLERAAMTHEYEKLVKNKNILTNLRQVISKNPCLEAAVQESMQSCYEQYHVYFAFLNLELHVHARNAAVRTTWCLMLCQGGKTHMQGVIRVHS